MSHSLAIGPSTLAIRCAIVFDFRCATLFSMIQEYRIRIFGICRVRASDKRYPVYNIVQSQNVPRITHSKRSSEKVSRNIEIANVD